MKITSPLLVLASLGLAASASAQGADDCTTPEIIVGAGTYAYDTTLATDSLIPVSCSVSGTFTNLNLDVWFEWTADFSGIAIFTLCAGGSHDSKIAVWPSTPGACPLPGTELACDDDACGSAQGFTSETSFAVTSGTSYLLGIGCYTTETGVGTFTVVEDGPREYTANGHYYQVVDAPNITWDAAKVAAEGMSHLGVAGHLATLTDQGENDFVFALGGVHWHWIGGFQNTSSPSYTEPGGGWEWITGEPWSYTNWGANEPNDTGAYPHEDYVELLSGSWPDVWNDAHPQEHPAGYVVEFPVGGGAAFCFGDGSDGGACPCGNTPLVGSGEGCYNVSGVGAKLAASGLASVANDTLSLTVSQAAPSDFGIFVQNITVRATPAPFYNGLFCLNADAHLVRHYAPPAIQPTVTDPAGSGSNAQAMTVGDFLNDTQPGVTMYYQFWGRDNGGPCGIGANFSSGLAIVWVP